MVTVVRGPNVEDISYNRVDGGSSLKGPIDGWSIITARGGSVPGWCLGNPKEIEYRKTRASSSRSELVIAPFELSKLTSSATMSAVH